MKLEDQMLNLWLLTALQIGRCTIYLSIHRVVQLLLSPAKINLPQ